MNEEYNKIQRPVIVLDIEKMEVLSVRVTTTPPRENDPYDTPILYWEHAKLRMKSTARVSKTMLVNKSQFIHIIGDLHQDDFENVQQQFMRYINDNI
ncbi:type II toxin-antitoxin system PemK/MazF family toxin [Alkaliphilus flagellatus]|uniref:type II toxin-antitoxin system PemK/MazF family toxin n=1 Tax=Alkaliphilus flagellatus TaxID=2841507 RepID=UPI002ED04988